MRMTSGFLFFMCLKVATAAALLCRAMPAAVNDSISAMASTLLAVGVLVGAAIQDAAMLLHVAGVTP